MSGFHHSEKVPTQYKKATAILRTALENRNKSLKTLVLGAKHARVRSLQVIVQLYADNRQAIDAAIEKTKILEQNPRLNPILCKVLIIEAIFRKHKLIGSSKPVNVVREYQDRLEEVLKVAAKACETKKATIKPRYVRVNTNLLSLEKAHKHLAKKNFRQKKNSFDNYEEFLKAVQDLAENEYMLDMHVNNLLIFHPNKKVLAVDKYTLTKKFMLQDKGTSMVAELLSPPVGSTILDMCAAPGMKTVHICNVLQNQGKIYAVERNTDRYVTLRDMVKAAGCDIVTTINADALTITAEQCPGVEYILVDPSCTGSGIQNRLSLESETKDEARIRKLAGLQIKMLSYAMSAFPDVKRIVYSTCSLYKEENEEVVQKCLRLNPSFKLLSGKKALRKNWHSFGSPEFKNIGKNCIYCKPKEDLTDGIFVALFEKCGRSDNE